jgi:hypothetical protein
VLGSELTEDVSADETPLASDVANGAWPWRPCCRSRTCSHRQNEARLPAADVVARKSVTPDRGDAQAMRHGIKKFDLLQSGSPLNCLVPIFRLEFVENVGEYFFNLMNSKSAASATAVLVRKVEKTCWIAQL